MTPYEEGRRAYISGLTLNPYRGKDRAKELEWDNGWWDDCNAHAQELNQAMREPKR